MRRALFLFAASAFAWAGIVVVTPTGASASGGQVDYTDYDPGNFHEGAKVDNRFLPLSPGTQFTYEGTTTAGVHQIVFTVTDLTKEIDGIDTRVIYDVDSTDGVLEEAELAFMAQDDSENVWNMGEYPEVYDETGAFLNADATWIATVGPCSDGIEPCDAQAGVGMRARPRPGTHEYTQGLIPSIEFHDVGKVVAILPRLCVPVGCFNNVVKIQETNVAIQPPEGFQYKYYAPNVGLIQIDFVAGDATGEQMYLVKVKTLKSDALERARNAAIRLDRRAYRIAGDFYGETPRVSRG